MASNRKPADSERPGDGGEPVRRNTKPPVSRVLGVLTAIKGPEPEGSLPVEDAGQYTIGRGRENDLVFADISMSRKHITVVAVGAEVKIVDAGSGNGTRLNGRRVKDAVLADGDL